MAMGRRDFFRGMFLLPAAIVPGGGKGEMPTVLSCKAKMGTVKAERVTIEKVCMITGNNDRVVMSGVSVPAWAADPVLTMDSLKVAGGCCVKIGKVL